MPGEKAFLWLDKDAPSAEQIAKALAFVRQGGLLIAPAYWGPAGVKPTISDPSIQYRCIMLDRGKSRCRMKAFRIRTRWRSILNCW